MTVKRIPVRVRSIRPRWPDPTEGTEGDERPEAVSAAPSFKEGPSPAAERPAQPDDVRAHGVDASKPCGGEPVLELGAGQDDLLSDVLSIADNLERALALAQEDTPIRQGVALTHRGVLQLLRKHGLERIEVHQQSFDPHWHEAIDVVSAEALGVDPGTVVQVMAAGYRRGERLFRPARVVVAQ
jgi:hypothetical protein